MNHAPELGPENRRIIDIAPRLVRRGTQIGGAALAISALLALLLPGGWTQFFSAYLVGYTYVLSLALGALFFVLLQHAARAGWSVVLRRLAEAVAGTLPALALLSLPVLLGMGYLYAWARPDEVAGDALLQIKEPYLNPMFFLLRMVIYFVVWIGLSSFLYGRSVRQDETGDPKLTLQMQAVSAPGIALYAITLTFASIDLLMSLDPHWYSTIFGVYYFSGGLVGALAVIVVMARQLQRAGRLTSSITVEHYHDLGKLLLGFVVFWAYIAFSQYMLIWYANIPEETAWFLIRQEGSWRIVSIVLLVGHFALPFVLLLSRVPKRKPAWLAAIAVWLLVMHYVDLYWLIKPALSADHVPVHVLDLTCFIGLAALFVAAGAQRLRHVSLVPQRDPKLTESLTFENV